MSPELKILVVEDGSEYTTTLSKFLSTGFEWTRAGSGPAGLSALASGSYDAIYLDMRFDRVPEDQLLGDVQHTADRFNGDIVQARRFLEDHQGLYILAEIRAQNDDIPVLISYDFESEQRRWSRLLSQHRKIDFVPDHAAPAQIASLLRGLCAS